MEQRVFRIIGNPWVSWNQQLGNSEQCLKREYALEFERKRLESIS
jgi:hypothetical protein